MQIVSKFITDAAVIASKIATDAVTTGKILADAVTDAKIRLANAGYLRARNAAGSADVNVIRVNASDKVEFPSVPQIASGTPSASADIITKGFADGAYAAIGSTGVTFGKETKTLSGGDITAQYVDLAQPIKASSLVFVVNGVTATEGTDYTISLTGGAGGNTRVTFAGDLATGGNAALVAADVISFTYAY